MTQQPGDSDGRSGRLAGKAGIITGAASRLGAGIAHRLAADGARLCLADTDAARGTALAAALGDAAFFVQTDLQIDGSIQQCVREAVDQFGGLDLLVNGACTYRDGGIAAERAD